MKEIKTIKPKITAFSKSSFEDLTKEILESMNERSVVYVDFVISGAYELYLPQFIIKER